MGVFPAARYRYYRLKTLSFIEALSQSATDTISIPSADD